jgi:hypothetical protein
MGLMCCGGGTQEGKQLAGRLGPFEKKWLVLGIVEGDPKARGKEPLGRVVVNLADYAAEDARGTQTCTVACRREISSAVGEVKMLITIGCGVTFTRSSSCMHHDHLDGL